MNVKSISLALASLALMSASSAYAAGISANVGPVGASIGAGPLGIGAGVNVGGLGAGVNVGGSSNILTYPAVTGETVLGAPTVLSYPATYAGAQCANPCATRTGFFGRLFNRNRTLFDLSAFGMGVKLGGNGPDLYGPKLLGANSIIYPSTSIAGAGLTGCGLNTMSAVIPNTYVGGGTGLNGERLGNPWLDLGLFKWGFRAGVVNPNWDMRPAGL